MRSDFSFRGEDSERHVGGKFVTKFHRPSNQTQRRNMAINQANFFESDEELTPGQKSAMRASMGDDREPFVLQMPNTSSKVSRGIGLFTTDMNEFTHTFRCNCWSNNCLLAHHVDSFVNTDYVISSGPTRNCAST
jgi:hypothetical protein